MYNPSNVLKATPHVYSMYCTSPQEQLSLNPEYHASQSLISLKLEAELCMQSVDRIPSLRHHMSADEHNKQQRAS